MRTSEQNEQIVEAFGKYKERDHNGGKMIYVMHEGQMYCGAGPYGGIERPLRHAIEAFYYKNIEKINEILNNQTPG